MIMFEILGVLTMLAALAADASDRVEEVDVRRQIGSLDPELLQQILSEAMFHDTWEEAQASEDWREVTRGLDANLSHYLWKHHHGWDMADSDPVSGSCVWRFQDVSDLAVLEEGMHVGEGIQDVRFYVSWSSTPALACFRAPRDRDVLEVSGLSMLANRLDGHMRTAEQWMHRWEDETELSQVMGFDPEAREALRAEGYTWLRYRETSGTTLAYVGLQPLRGHVVARRLPEIPWTERTLEALDARWS
jgi:hypothetical protein